MGIGNPHGYPDYTWPMVWVLQDGELWPIEQWVAHIGVEKLWYVSSDVAAGSYTDTSLYTVPAGKRLYVVRLTAGGQGKGKHSLDALFGVGRFIDLWTGPYGSLNVNIAPPITLGASQILRVRQTNYDTASLYFTATIQSYEIDV